MSCSGVGNFPECLVHAGVFDALDCTCHMSGSEIEGGDMRLQLRFDADHTLPGLRVLFN